MSSAQQAAKAGRTFTRREVEKHNKEGDLWIIIDSTVYDLTKFKDLHPGGDVVLTDKHVAGKDATSAFYGLHRHSVLQRPAYRRLIIGYIEGEKPSLHSRFDGELSDVPYAEPVWLSKGFKSPYFGEKEKNLQKEMRKFVDEVLIPEAVDRELSGKRPSQEAMEKMGELNIHAMTLGPGAHLEGRTLLGGVIEPKEFKYMHEMIIQQEMGRFASRGYQDGMQSGLWIGLPPVLSFAPPHLKKKVSDEVLSGKKYICLAISEAFAGSDVAGIRTTAQKSPDGKRWIVNGTKKWITNSTFADYFTTACKTEKGYVVLLITKGDGVEVKPIKTAYSSAAGTGYVIFNNVEVPYENLLGEEDKGFSVIMNNFNHERLVMACKTIAGMRLVIEECFLWANQREVFGKNLLAQPVIREKLAHMVAQVEALQSWLEQICFQMDNMSKEEQKTYLAGQIALLKMQSTRVADFVSSEAVQVFGGRGLTKTGMGRTIEEFQRTRKFDAVLGGSEEILADLGIRQALKRFPANARL